jgi:hypothetical protein
VSCPRCYELCVTYPARTPGALRKAVSIVNENLIDSTIREIPTRDSSFFASEAFQAVANGSEWPDTFNFWFECVSCGERFSLEADTYHGAGGQWKPEADDASRESL